MSEERLLTFAEAATAFDAGKDVQWRIRGSGRPWNPVRPWEPWNPIHEEYRLKPEPASAKIIWMNEYANSRNGFGHATQEEAEHFATLQNGSKAFEWLGSYRYVKLTPEVEAVLKREELIK